jgi:hypothetical protein
MSFQRLAAQLGLATLILAALAAFAAMAVVRLGYAPFSAGLIIMTAATVLAGLALLCALAWLMSALKHNRGDGKRAGVIALAGSILLLAPPLHAIAGQLTSPAIHDATTNPDDPPQFVALARLRKPGMNSPVYDGSEQIHYHGETNTANYMLHTYYAGITKPYARLQMTKAKLFWHAFETAKGQGWTIVDYSEKDGRIEATDTSLWFGQVSDIVIRVQESGALGARLDVRSESETGVRDFGSNLARIKAYLKAL